MTSAASVGSNEAMKAEDIDDRHRAVCRISREAGQIARRYFEDLGALVVESKGVQDYVSAADRAVERHIIEAIAREFPRDRCIGEESGGERGDAVWVIDPIDGTHNFLRGFPHYGVSIAFVAENRVEAGAVYDPSADLLYSARRGAGATCNGRRLSVRPQTALDHALISIGYTQSVPVDDFLPRFSALIRRRCEYRRIGSAALALAHVAAGHFDAFWQVHLHAWDVLAGILLVQEAGGWANDFLAGEGLTHGNPILATTPGLKDELRAILGVG